MPLYTYRCNNCDHEFEVRQRMTDDPVTVCPVCSGGVRRVVSSVGVVFKGSGFYVTDNRTSSANGGSSKGHAHSKTGEGSSDSTAKPAASTESSGSASGSASESSSKSSGDSASSG